METQKGPSVFIFGIIAIIVGSALLKQFDFETFRFRKFALSMVYLVTFVVSVYLVIKGLKNKQQPPSA